MVSRDRRYRLRPSVSVVPTTDPLVVEFFQSNTRRIKHIRVSNEHFIKLLTELDGSTTLDELTKKYSNILNIEKFISFLYESCFIEDVEVSHKINNHSFNRVINFIADYFPTHKAYKKFQEIQNSHVVIIGCGAIGSWVAHMLCQSGITNFTLCDTDIVTHRNMNRSLYYHDDIGEKKVTVLKNHLQRINKDVNVYCVESFIDSESKVYDLLDYSEANVDLVINCADTPNVDTTSKLICKPCMKRKIPHIIAGGYNLHLSLIGPTILPGKSACFNCIQLGLEKELPINFSKTRKLHRTKKRNIGNLAPLAGISSSFVVFEAIRVLINSSKMKPLMINRRGEFNFLTSKINFSEYPKLPYCSWCSEDDI